MLVTFWPLGQAVKTSPFHGGNTGSIPVGVNANHKFALQTCFLSLDL